MAVAYRTRDANRPVGETIPTFENPKYSFFEEGSPRSSGVEREMPKAVFLTHDAEPAGTDDDALAIAALAAGGVKVEAVPWSRPGPIDAQLLVLRSTWDYHLHEDAFRDFLTRAERAGARLVNPPEVVRWNLHKGYLVELAARGLPVVDTQLVTRAKDGAPLGALLAARGITEAVVKPAVSANAKETYRCRASALDEARFARLRADGDLLVQPYVPEIEQGELSFVFLGGRFSHAVRKRAKVGDFRVQEDHGGTVEPFTPTNAQRELAARILDAAFGELLYARVDLVARGESLLLMELELIEPELFFRFDERSAERFATLLTQRLGQG